MPLFKAKARQTTAVERVSEGAETYIRALRDGTISTASFINAMSIEGRVFHIDVGTFSSPITFTAGGLVVTTPDVAGVVPSGVCIMPIELAVQIETEGTVLIAEICAISGANGTVSTAGTAVTPVNYRTDAPYSSAMKFTYTAITAVAPTVQRNEFWRDGVGPGRLTKTPSATVSVVDSPYKFQWSAVTSGILPIIMPSGSLFLYGPSTQAGTGFWKASWIELPVAAMV